MIEFNRIFTGGRELCPAVIPGLAFVHACKTCHRKRFDRPTPNDPNYLYGEHRGELYLNLIDPDTPLFRIELFTHALPWMEQRWHQGHDIIIHCDQGRSRSRSLALLLAARLHLIDSTTFHDAATDFSQQTQYPYQPSRGIEIFLQCEWENLMKMC